jgi:hypothetical protein
MTRNPLTLLFSLGIYVSLAGQTPATDWPQWQGPDRNGLSKETGLLQQWPASGPPIVWSVSTLGGGYGSVAIKGDRMFVQGAKGGQSIVYALNRADGKGLWSKALGASGRTIADLVRAARRRSMTIVSAC